jgi:DNA-directed RNA polymerase beta' subunit
MTTNIVFKESNVELYRVDGVTLSVLSPEEVEAMSVTRVCNDQIYNANGDPEIDAINDERMGTMDRDRHCKTCMGS